MRVLVLVLFFSSIVSAWAQGGVAQQPPMGWNSWDAYGLTITEPQFRANVEVQASKLKPFGWDYAVIDEGWFLENPEDRPTPDKLIYGLDAFGRYVPVARRFPSAGTGDARSFAELGRWVHGTGLKFGIHIVRGIPRESVRRNLPVDGSSFHAVDVADTGDACPWDPTNWGVRDNAAGQAWYDSLLRQYAAWGVDLLKVDCISNHPYKESEIRMIRRAIERSGRPMVLSLSPGPTSLEHAKTVGELAQMWRISDDIWDVWESSKAWPQTVKGQFARMASWARYAKPGNWPDADMLPIGELRPFPGGNGGPRSSKLTHDEQRTLMTLWSMGRSPLIVGANLTMLDDWTSSLLTNRDLIRVDQTASASRQVSQAGDVIAWTADLPGGEMALAVFNVGDVPAAVFQAFTAYGLKSGAWRSREVWTGQENSAQTGVKVTIPPHGCLLLTLRQ